MVVRASVKIDSLNGRFASEFQAVANRVFQTEKFKATKEAVLAFEGIVFFSVGTTLMQIGESFFAICCFVVMGFLLFAKALTLNGWAKNLAGCAGAVILSGILITITVLHKPDMEPWSNLQKFGTRSPHPTPAIPETPISFRLGCNLYGLPIHIQGGSSIHILRITPGTLIPTNDQHIIPDQGSFETITAEVDKPRDYPSEDNGRWLTKDELTESLKKGRGANPFISKCTLTSYTSATLDDIVAVLLVDTRDEKHHSYWVPFDPIMSSKSYEFYVISPCTSGVIPQMVQWNPTVLVRVLGESKIKTVPLRFEKQVFPPQLLAGSFGPSSFLWDGVGECKWDRNP
jgi:hypothetical protein